VGNRLARHCPKVGSLVSTKVGKGDNGRNIKSSTDSEHDTSSSSDSDY